MLYNHPLAALTAFAIAATVSADGLYSKGSSVLQVDGKSYNKLIAKSNQVSVSFYASDFNIANQNIDEIH